MIATALRGVAIAVAIAAVIDPAITLTRPARQTLAIVILPSPSLALPSDGGSRADRAAEIRAALASRLGRDFVIAAAPDASAAAVVLVGDRAPADLPLPDAARVYAVDVAAPLSPNVRVESVAAAAAHISGRVRIVSRVSAAGMQGRTTRLRLIRDELSLAEQTRTWASGDDTFDAVFETIPARSGFDVLRVEAVPDPVERTALDNTRTGAFAVDSRRLRVLFYDARPSWTTTFMRRTIEQELAFHVEFVTRVSPAPSGVEGRGLSVRAAGGAAADGLAGAALSSFDVVVIGGVDALTEADVDALRQFAASGGCVWLAPDRRVEGAASALVPARLEEKLYESGHPLRLRRGAAGPRASEFLVARDLAPLGDVLAAIPDGPDAGAVVFKAPLGRGYLYLNGAMDAWRFRSDDYDAFVSDAIREAASDAIRPLGVTLGSNVAAAGDAVDVTVRVRDGAEGSTRASAELVAPDGARSMVRLWPAATAGTFTATLRPAAIGTHTLHVSSASVSIDAHVLVRARADVPPDRPGELRAFASAHGGATYDAGALDDLVKDLRSALPARREPRAVGPMRSAWWMVPFAACLCGEWWIRRRRGLR